jgi:hypothetical protein
MTHPTSVIDLMPFQAHSAITSRRTGLGSPAAAYRQQALRGSSEGIGNAARIGGQMPLIACRAFWFLPQSAKSRPLSEARRKAPGGPKADRDDLQERFRNRDPVHRLVLSLILIR